MLDPHEPDLAVLKEETMSPIRDDDRPKRSGCRPWILGCVGVPLVLAVGCIALISGGFFWARSSLPSKGALERARANPAVREALGAPLKSKLFGDNNVMVYNSKNGRTAEATFSIPISGPKGSGTILVAGDKSKGTWHYHRMEVKIDKTGATIDLLTPTERSAAPDVVEGDRGEPSPP